MLCMAQVKAHGLATVETPAPLRQPHGTYGFGFKDPEGRNSPSSAASGTTPTPRISADRPRKLSHINLNAGASDADRRLLREALGFSLVRHHQAAALSSCNSDHHSVVVGFSGGATVNHLAFEMPDLDTVMRGAGRMRDARPRHRMGPRPPRTRQQCFCYFLGPEDFPIEYTARCSRSI